MKQTALTISTPKDFDFSSTVYSHGWCALPPFSVNRSTETLERPLALPSGRLVHSAISDASGALRIRVRSTTPLSSSDRAAVRLMVGRCLRLGEDFSPFHRLAASLPEYRWISARRAGRLLRSPTVFEDLVKMICTTNCSWKLTTAIVGNLCRALGQGLDATHWAFPTPRALAASSEEFLRTRVKAGYRAPYLLALARSVESGAIDPETWVEPSLAARDVYGQLRSIKGIGDYAAGNMLKLLGHYDYLGLDSWVRTQYARLHHNGRRVKDSTIARRYQAFGRWRGLLFWLEMTREWYDAKFPIVR